MKPSYTSYIPAHILRLNSRGLRLGPNGNLDVLLGEVHVGCEGAVGLPLARVAGSALLQHLVDLLEGEALGLGDEKEGE
jgi:hypothetical protein